MSQGPHDPNTRPDLGELDEPLRRAVEAVRKEPMPRDALERALNRAAQLETTPIAGAVTGDGKARWRFAPRRFLAVGGLAAAVLISGLVWYGRPGGQEEATRVADARGAQPRDSVLADKERTESAPAAEEPAPTTRLGTARAPRPDDQTAAPAGKPATLAPAMPGIPPATAGSGPDDPTRRPRSFALPDVRAKVAVEEKLDRISGARPMAAEAKPAPVPAPRPATPGEPGGAPSSGRFITPGAHPSRPLTEGRKEADAKYGDKALPPAEQQSQFRRQSNMPADAAPAAKAAAAPSGPPMANPVADPAARSEPRMAEDELKRLKEVGKPLGNVGGGLGGFGAPTKKTAESAAGGFAGRKPADKDKAEDNKALEKKLQVWHRDRQRPTFARVYVGDGNALELVSLQVTTTVEGPRARTVVDHIFRNPHGRQLEGTFEYPLPTGASASYFAMFLGQTRDTVPPRFRGGDTAALPADALAKLEPAELVKRVNTADWGPLQEARVVAKAKALETYEDIVRGRIDPALLEYAGGNTFSGRVFPIPPNGYNRVLLAYEELLPATPAGVQYRYALPDCKLASLQFTLNTDATEIRDVSFRPEDSRKSEGAGRVSYTRSWTGQGPGGDVFFTFTPAKPAIQAISGRPGESGPLSFYARVRPELPVEAARPFAEHAVFLLDTSLSESPDRFGVSMRLLQQILETDAAIKHFNVLSFDVAGRWVEPKGWLENSPGGREQALSRLDGVVLEGATNLSAALDLLVRPGGPFEVAPKTPVNVFLLSDGQITWGESEVATLVARFEEQCRFPVRFHCYRTGLGADNLELFEALTRRGGGIFHCFGEADLAAAAAAHRSQCFQLERVNVEGLAVSDFVIAGRRAAVYPGGELVVAGRAAEAGQAKLVLEGTFLGKPLTREYPLDVRGGGELAPRGWAEVAVASLLSLNDPKLDDLVTAYCQQFGIGSRVASFLVLENANDYKRLDLESERGKTVPGGDLGRFLNEAWARLGRPVGPKAAYESFLKKIRPRVQVGEGSHAHRLLGLLTDKDFDLPESSEAGQLLKAQDVPPAYLATLQTNRRDAAAYTAEARRRADGKDVGGAVRALSSIVEEFPSRSDALRLVGYRLLDLQQPGAAARLFRQVQAQRPFEPHSYRDLARGLEDCGRFGLAALQYELVLAGTWHNRFRDSLKQVAQEEYVRLMRQAIRQQALRPELLAQFGERLEQIGSTPTQSDLRVSVSWNTDATDVDLWVIEPDGTKCFYSHNRTKNGGELSQDQTQGYGPERYQVRKAQPGVYTVVVHYFSVNANLLAGETHVNVAVTRHADSPREEVRRHTVILRKHNEQVEVCRVKVE